jgi:hypothetical protein
MSAAVTTALTNSEDLKPTERLVLITVVAHQNAHSSNARPSVPTIAHDRYPAWHPSLSSSTHPRVAAIPKRR